MSKDFSHFDETGGISMVDVAAKRNTHREAVAVATVRMKPETMKKLIEQALRLLTPDGTIVFSCNHHRFELRTDEAPHAAFTDLSQETLPRDFHDPRTHRWAALGSIRRAQAATSRGRRSRRETSLRAPTSSGTLTLSRWRTKASRS